MKTLLVLRLNKQMQTLSFTNDKTKPINLELKAIPLLKPAISKRKSTILFVISLYRMKGLFHRIRL